jgi:flagellar basal body-associated protein FliL
MASEKPAAAPAATTTDDKKDAPKKSGNFKVLLAAVVVVALEAVTVVATVKLTSGPRAAIAEQPVATSTAPAERDVEVKLIDAKLPNGKSGRVWLYDLAVVAKVSEKNKEKLTGLFAEREAEVRDKVRVIIASADPKALNEEPGLETVRRQISYQLEQSIGRDMIKEVLIPKCTPIRTE